MPKRTPLSEIDALLRSADLERREPYRNKGTAMLCECSQGHEVRVMVSVIRRGQRARPGGTGCRFCLGQEIAPEDAVRDMIELGRVTPQEPFPGAQKPWRCVCPSCGDTVRPRLSSVRMGRRGCRSCAIKEVAKSHRLDDHTAREIMLAAGAEPAIDFPYPGMLKPWPSTCLTCGEDIQPRLANVKTGHAPCRHCVYIALAERRRIPEEDARAEMLERGNAEPLEPYPGAHQPWLCKCLRCDRESTPRLISIRQGQGACRYCADKGFDFAAPSIVYLGLLDNPKEHGGPIVKIGVAGQETQRVRIHENRGWQMIRVFETPTGQLAYEVEQSVLKAWRDHGLTRVAKSLVPAGDGYTESAFAIEAMPVLEQLDLDALVQAMIDRS